MAEPEPAESPRSCYLHIPYCAAKCPYCDFNSIAGRDDEQAAYVDALLTEVRRLPRGPYDTVFIGGGTPSILPPELLELLLVGLRGHLLLSDDYEWTCEANPGSVDAERFRLLAEHGVNRLSLGVQSTRDLHLRFLGRVHDGAEAVRAVELALATFPRVSCDIIVGLPDQTPAELDEDLAWYQRFGLRHASVYHLAIEPGTEFHARHRRGELPVASEEQARATLERVWEGLENLGLLPYETSNFAQPGEECRHNLAYWTQQDYVAAGAGAVSTIGTLRETRQPHPARYIAAVSAGDPVSKREWLEPLEQQREAWMLGLRLRTGVARRQLERVGDPESRWRSIVASLVAEGLVTDNGSHIALSEQGRILQDSVTVALMP